MIGPIRASESTQVAVTLEAAVAGTPVEVTGEYTGPPARGGKGSWKFGWRWDLGEATLADILQQHFGVPLEGLPGVQDIKPGAVTAAYFTGASSRGLSFGIANLSFVHIKAGEATCWGIVHEAPIEIPTSGLVAMLLGKQVRLSRLRVGNVSGSFGEGALTEAKGQFPEAGLLLGDAGAPTTAFVAGLTIEGIGAAPIALPDGLFGAERGALAIGPGRGTGPARGAGAPGGGTPTARAPAPIDTSEGFRKWFSVNKTLGPLRIARVGCEWRDGKIGLLLDAAVDTGPLRLGLTGLAIRLPPSDPKPENLDVGLDGMDVAFRGGPLTISGGLLRSEVRVEGERVVQYDGMVLIKAADLSVIGLGSYASLRGQPSLFIFAVLHKELPGPPAFRLNGLAVGFGYNRRLKLPSIEEVQDFPLVRAALDPDYFARAGAEDPVQAAMRRLRDYIPPAIGEYWFSIGIRFTSFEMIQAFAMLSVSFGSDVSISILGLASLTIPRGLPLRRPPLCYAELALRAELNPSAGILSVEARLTSNSYIFDTACKLTGGFAFFVWFKGAHQGDFVVTLGGYHPKFVPPAHYPLVPRLGVNWIVVPELRISGELYFALTPSCLMAGGKLSAVFDVGWLKAWFIAYADFLIGWKPFRYDIALGVSIGVSVNLGVDIGPSTISLAFTFEIGTDLHLWGPPFAGTARVTFYIVSFTVKFGDQDHPAPTPLPWDEFSKSFLPPSNSVCGIACTGGLLREWRRDDGTSVAVVDGHEFAFRAESQAPCTEIRWARQGEREPGSDDWAGKLGVAPMYAGDLTSALTVEVSTRDGQPVSSDLFSTSIIRKRFPGALWGQGRAVLSTPTSHLLEGVPAGIAIGLSETAKQAQIRHSLPAMKLHEFAYERIPKGIPWSGIRLPEDIEAPGTRTLANTIWGNDAVDGARAGVLAALAAVTPYPLNDVSLAQTAARAATIFQAEPTFAALGQLLPEER